MNQCSRRWLLSLGCLAILGRPGWAEDDPGRALGLSPYFVAPGLYGTAWGSPGFGSIRTTTKYSSPYGMGYGYGYGPTSVNPGRFGAGLWRPGTPEATEGIHRGTVYSTFAVPYRGPDGFGPPGIGVYAPAFGPPYLPVAPARGWP